MKKSQSISDRKVQKVMHEFKHGTLKTYAGQAVKNRRQAIAIALSEARRAKARGRVEK